MRVKELIEKLQKLNPEAPVTLMGHDFDDFDDVRSIYVTKAKRRRKVCPDPDDAKSHWVEDVGGQEIVYIDDRAQAGGKRR